MKKDKIISILLGFFVLIILILTILFSTVSKPAKVIGQSMEPTLHNGQIITINKMHKSLQQGDIVVFIKQNSASNKKVVKRVIALEGQTVEFKNGNVYVDGQIYDYVGKSQIEPTYNKIVLIPEDHFFALGDNWSNSIDSREYGPVNYKQLIGIMN